jgi:hypothetical protein
MTRASSVYFAACAAVVIASLVYVAPAFTTVPVLWYYPLAHTWALQGRPDGFALDWYGRTLWAVLSAAIAFGAAHAVASRMSPPHPRAYRVWAVWVGMTTLLAIAVYTYQLAGREPIPEPMPAGYDGH